MSSCRGVGTKWYDDMIGTKTGSLHFIRVKII